MKHQSMLGLASLGVYFCISGFVLAGTYSGGDGTEGNPYQIANKADLLELGATPEDYGAYFVLTANIDLAGEIFTEAVIAPDTSNSENGFQGTIFGGVFEGNHHKIFNLTYDTSNDYVGLFGHTNNAVIKNLGIENVHIAADYWSDNLLTDGWSSDFTQHNDIISSSSTTIIIITFPPSYVGGVVAYLENSSLINCHSNSIIVSSYYSPGDTYIGGLAGYQISGAIVDCSNTGSINTSERFNYAGGVAGCQGSGDIINCYNSGSITSCIYGGGLTGYQESGSITESFNTGSITALNYAGGLAGRHGSGMIASCYNMGSITSSGYSGGLTGKHGFGTISDCWNAGAVISSSSQSSAYAGGLAGIQTSGTLKNCYSTGIVDCISNSSSYSSYYCYAGGLVGCQERGVVTQCYSTGHITAGGTAKKYTGGLIGFGGYAINSFWDIETSGFAVSAGGNGRTTEQMKSAVNYVAWNTPEQSSWIIHEGVDYPQLAWQNPAGVPLPAHLFSDFIPGAGSAENPYQISTPQQLNMVGLFPDQWDKVFCLENDVDMSSIAGVEFNRIGIGEYICFSGTFEGNGHHIHNLNYDSDAMSDYVGLFGCIKKGTIRDLGVEHVNIHAKGKYVGALAGYLDHAAVIQCYSTGSVNSSVLHGNLLYAGGLTGHQYYSNISSSYSSVSVTACAKECYAGGLVGSHSYGTITNSSGQGTVAVSSESTSHAGGLAGHFNGTMSNCHSAAIVNVSFNSTSYAGGLTGDFSGTMSNCFSSGSIAACTDHASFSYAGGLAGDLSGTVLNCYFTGSVEASAVTSCAGGLAGSLRSDSDIEQCYSTGLLFASGNTVYKGGLVAYKEERGTISGCFWDTETSGSAEGIGDGDFDPNNVQGKSTEQMQMLSTFTGSGWDFVTTDGDIADWFLFENQYPQLIWEITDFVPDVLSLSEQEAIAMLVEANYLHKIILAASPHVPLGYVMNQSPDGAMEVSCGTPITLTISLGPQYAGCGTEADPYQIATKYELMILSVSPAHYGSQFVLTADIDLAGETFASAVIAPDRENNEGVEFTGTEFTGIFDGNGHKISNCVITSGGRYLGLFGQISSEGKVKNLGVENVRITGEDYSRINGSLVGCNYGELSRCYSTNIVSGERFCGGLAGQNYGAISYCHSDGYVVSRKSSAAGGLVGFNGGSIYHCYSTGSVSGDGSVGGLVGSTESSASIAYCYSTCHVSGDSGVGGLVGSNSGASICNSYSAGHVYGHDSVGGLVGYNYGTINNSYSTGSISHFGNSYYIGGLVGYNSSGYITGCYSAGKVYPGNSSSIGGLVGISGYIDFSDFDFGNWTIIEDESFVQSSFWDIQASGQADSSGGMGKTTAEMQLFSTFTDAGWDFTEGDGDAADWFMLYREYPHFSWEPAINAGSGTAEDPYEIWFDRQMNSIGLNPSDWASHFRLMTDIDMSMYSGTEYHIIGNSATKFTGTFDGNGHVISDLYYSTGVTTDSIGLFGRIENAVIKNLILDDVYVSSGSGNVGGLVGWNDAGMLSRCAVRGMIQGTGHVGGLVGRNNGGVLTGCRVEAWVNGTSIIGGLVGGNYSGSIENCYAVASVNGAGNYIGGLTGFNSKGTLLVCYAAGEFGDTGAYVGGVAGWNSTGSTVDACFWDMQVSGNNLVVGGGLASGITGKTTAEMQMVSTFTDAGWDFAGEADNGTVDIWRMCVDGVGYPRLSWEFGRRGDFACPDGVGVEDLEALGMVWLKAEGQAGYSIACDADSNERIDIADFKVLAGQWMGD